MRYWCLFALLFCCSASNAAPPSRRIFSSPSPTTLPGRTSAPTAANSSTRRTSIASPREGVLFNNFFTPIPKCSPSRACDSHRPRSMAARRRLRSLRNLPRQIQSLSRSARASGLLRRLHGQRLGAGRLAQGRLYAKSRRAGIQPTPAQAADHRHSAHRLRRQLRGVPQGPPRGQAVLLLVRRARAASPLRRRLGRAASANISTTLKASAIPAG